MSGRIRLARFLLRLGAFIQSLPVIVMQPDDLVEFSRQSYSTSSSIESWTEDVLVESGLWPEEIDLINSIEKQGGELLLLGVGGGREAIPFTQMGYKVTGVDFIPAMVEQAIQNAEKRGFQINGLVQEISTLDVPEPIFDVVWISRAMYSCVPTRRRRVNMIHRIYQAMKPGGVLFCQFHSGLGWQNDGTGESFRRIIAKSPIGNRTYENGDTLWLNVEFVHIFTSETEIRSELEEGGLDVIKIKMDPTSIRGNAVCEKSCHTNSSIINKDGK